MSSTKPTPRLLLLVLVWMFSKFNYQCTPSSGTLSWTAKFRDASVPKVFSPAPATSTGRCPFCHNGSSTNTSVVVLNQFLTQPLRKPCSCMLTPKVQLL
uniref:Uncharacterized protein n=1 Tax=Aegilops tauschii subsp. strangulata TaxID=200361 RepID=A0A453I2T8_AEGTS